MSVSASIIVSIALCVMITLSVMVPATDSTCICTCMYLVQATQEDYRDVVGLCRETVRRAKVQLELNLDTAVKDNKKCFYKYINNKRRAKENRHPLLDAGGNIVTKDE